jgi:hypothetical protein
MKLALKHNEKHTKIQAISNWINLIKTKKLNIHNKIKKTITQRNNFNTIISKRNKQFHPCKNLIKPMTPIEKQILIFPNVKIDNRYYIDLSSKVWNISNIIYTRQEKVRLNHFKTNFKQQIYKALTWNYPNDNKPMKVTPKWIINEENTR